MLIEALEFAAEAGLLSSAGEEKCVEMGIDPDPDESNDKKKKK